MPLRKSYFSLAVYLNCLRRHWTGAALLMLMYIFIPIVYGIGLNSTVVMLNTHQNGVAGLDASEWHHYASMFVTSSEAASAICGIMACSAFVAAIIVFAYLHDTRASYMLHSLPVTREAHFISSFLGALSLLMIPAAATGVLILGVQAAFGFFAPQYVLLWLVLLCITAVFFLGVTSFIGMLTGHAAAHAVLTLIFINLPLIVEGLAILYQESFYFSYAGPTEPVTMAIHPIMVIISYFSSLRDVFNSPLAMTTVLTPIIAFAVGLIFTGLAMVLYRLRRVEAAGDIIAMRAVKPVFRCGIAFIFSAMFGVAFRGMLDRMDSLAIELIFASIGGIIGYLIAEMMLLKTPRVLGRIRHALIYTAVYAVFVACIALDLFGYDALSVNNADYKAVVISPMVPYRVNVSMQPESYSEAYSFMWQDLELTGADAFISEIYAKGSAVMTEDIRRQILEQDPVVFTPEDGEAAVRLQNMLASMKDTLRAYGNITHSGVSDYYYFSLRAKRNDGQIVRRNYNFMLPQGAEPELRGAIDAMYAEIIERSKAGLVLMGERAESVRLNYYYLDTLDNYKNDYDARLKNFELELEAYEEALEAGETDIPPPLPPDVEIASVRANEARSFVLNRGEWDGLVEAMQKDNAVQYRESFGESSIGVVGISFIFEREECIITIQQGDEHTLAWLVDRGYVDAERLAEFERYVSNDASYAVVYR